MMIYGWNLFEQSVINEIRSSGNSTKIVPGQGDNYATGCLLDYSYFIENYRSILKDLTKQYALDVDPKAIQHSSFTENLQHAGNTKMFLLSKKSKKISYIFSQGTVNVLYRCHVSLIWYYYKKMSITVKREVIRFSSR